MEDMKLYDYADQYQNLINFMEENDYSFEEMKDTLESIQESAEGKVINIGKVIQKYQDDIKVISERKKALDELKKKAERNIDNLKQYGLVQMSRLDMKKVASPTLTVSIRNSKVMNIKDESKLPKEYITEKVEKKVDKAAFKKYYNGLSTEEQEAIDYAEIEVKQNILIK
ncbi:siphovirus Gp157 family protein [Staphylococcus haemolyticus]|uniref:siphovirus Gp157 family protein n=1 Tax=Staphylococcus haemolyticus TaxID=1283 RepID=UPI0018793E41|nr:siphovirus Gp157 family protein [Staphylococcus haemolyticus]MBE7352631.1 siphovirus Gp157 family protein [Staphylococcus haemolyticus]MBE7377656.1 siphovirus Gp157 family protein [Staphylococcus haemolyticus]MCC2093452.1 siphovirus Gp157 family protein [Staphylococcus haemolyticus]